MLEFCTCVRFRKAILINELCAEWNHFVSIDSHKCKQRVSIFPVARRLTSRGSLTTTAWLLFRSLRAQHYAKKKKKKEEVICKPTSARVSQGKKYPLDSKTEDKDAMGRKDAPTVTMVLNIHIPSTGNTINRVANIHAR